MRTWGAIAVLAGCGRIGFAPLGADTEPTTYPETVMADGPIAYWPLDEAGGPTAHDIVGTADGTFTGTCGFGLPGALASAAGTAVDFTTCSVVLPDRFDFTGVQPFSIEAWINPKRTPTMFGHVLTREFRVAGAPAEGWALLSSPTGVKIERAVAMNINTSVIVPVPVGAYVHTVGVYDGATLHLYLDGVEAGAPIDDTRPAVSATASPEIGGVGGFNHFEGSIDELSLYDRALPAATIAAHHAAGLRL